MEYPPLKHFMFVTVFLGVFVLLVSLIPSGFLVMGEEFKERDVPEYFEALDLEKYASTYVHNITDDVYNEHWGKSEFGYDMMFYAYTDDWDEGGHQLKNAHGYTFWGYWTGGHLQEWINQNGISRGKRISDEEIDSDFDDETEFAEYTVKCQHFQMKAWLHYNVSSFNCSIDAWDNYNSEPFNGLSVLFAIEFDELGTGMNAWNLIGMMLFFQVPEGIPHPFNWIACFPIWVAEAWLIFAFIYAIIKAFPFT